MRQTLRRALLRPAFAPRVDLSGRRFVVTGCTPGSIGHATARLLASWGAELIITTRRDPTAIVQGLRAHGRVLGHALDLCDTASVAAFAAWVRTHAGERLDGLINNAGVHLDLLSQWQTPTLVDGHEIHWRTNFLGTMQLTQGLLPLLLQTAQTQGGARLVNVVSELHHRGRNADLPVRTRPYNSWNAYGNSKLALVHATFELQRRHGAQGLQACCLHPGAVYTAIADQGLAGNPVLERLRKAMAPIEAFFLLTPEEGAQTSVYCATNPAALGGQYYRACRAVPASAESADRATAQRLLAAVA